MSFLRTVAWVVAIIFSTIPAYWIIVHPRASRWGRARAPLRRVGPIWMSLWLMTGALTWRWRGVALYDTPTAWLVALPFFATGFFVYMRAKQSFTADQLLGRSELQPTKHEQRLVTNGIRARVRHPIYLGHLLEMMGWAIGSGLVVTFGLTVVAIVTGAWMIVLEDRELEQRFGHEYREYRENVPAVFPRLT